MPRSRKAGGLTQDVQRLVDTINDCKPSQVQSAHAAWQQIGRMGSRGPAKKFLTPEALELLGLQRAQSTG